MEALQDQAVEQHQEQIWLVRHPYCVGLGWACEPDTTPQYDQLPTFGVERGGGESVHGPGQIAAYVICDLYGREIPPRHWCDMLLLAAVRTCHQAGVDRAWVDSERGGVFVTDLEKIAAVGVRKTAGWTRWGVSVNVEGSVEPWAGINVCQDPSLIMTTLAQQGSQLTWNQVADILEKELQSVIQDWTQVNSLNN